MSIELHDGWHIDADRTFAPRPGYPYALCAWNEDGSDPVLYVNASTVTETLRMLADAIERSER